jgi:penicillin-binding protein 2
MERVTRVRVSILLLIFVVIVSFFALKLYHVQIVETGGKADNLSTFETRTRVKGTRGNILDTNGNVLVTNRASYDLVINHFVLTSSENPNRTLYQLVQVCKENGIEYTDRLPITKTVPYEYTLQDYNTTWQGYFQTFLIKRDNIDSDISAPLLMEKLRESYAIPQEWSEEDARLVLGLRYELSLRFYVGTLSNYVFCSDVSSDTLAAVMELNIPGMNVETTTVRHQVTKYASHILGYVGAMNAEQWEVYKEKDYSMDALVGQTGFEQAFEEYLHGIDGTRVDVVTKSGQLVRSYYETEPQPGKNVQVSIDLKLQAIAEDTMATTIANLRDPAINPEKDGRDAGGAAAVAMDIKTGQVLICASYPTFDLSTMKENFAAINEMKFDPMYNRALQGAYPPGSAFKMVTLTAAIENHKVTPDELITDTGVFTVPDDPNFRPTCLVYSQNRVTHQEVDGAKGLEVSCNVYFYELAYRLKIDEIDAVAKGFGLGEPTGIELSENIGHRSNPESKKQQYEGLSSGFFLGDRVLTGIGQAENRFTPMQLCVYASTLANKGTRYKATFLNRVVSSDYRTLISENQPEILSTMEVSSQSWTTYYEGMERVITGTSGTGRAFFGGIKDSYGDSNGLWGLKDQVVVYGKTGTAQTFKNVSDNSAFVCFAARPGGEPEIAIALYGEKVAHPTNLMTVAEEIVRAYFSRYQTSDAVTNENRIG